MYQKFYVTLFAEPELSIIVKFLRQILTKLIEYGYDRSLTFKSWNAINLKAT